MRTAKPKISARDRQAFVERVREIIMGAGARDDVDRLIYDYVIPATRVGPLYVSVHESCNGDGLGWIACRFLYPQVAAEIVGGERLNPHSGKWNHHYFGPWTLDDAVADFSRSLKAILVADAGASDAGRDALAVSKPTTETVVTVRGGQEQE